MIISRGYSKVTNRKDSAEVFKISIDNSLKTIDFESKINEMEKQKLHFTRKDKKLELSGSWKGKKIWALFSRKTYDDYQLTNRGFHWINEIPFNK